MRVISVPLFGFPFSGEPRSIGLFPIRSIQELHRSNAGSEPASFFHAGLRAEISSRKTRFSALTVIPYVRSTAADLSTLPSSLSRFGYSR